MNAALEYAYGADAVFCVVESAKVIGCFNTRPTLYLNRATSLPVFKPLTANIISFGKPVPTIILPPPVVVLPVVNR